MDAPYRLCEPIEHGIARVLARNPSPYTFTGTNSFLVGVDEVAVIDPGPDLDSHVEALVAAIAGRPVVALLCTHTHADHSPAARPLAAATGAPIIGCAPLAAERIGPGSEGAYDVDYAPVRVLGDGESIVVDGQSLSAVATPGHTSNHLCFSLDSRKVLFTGDHVMGWSTTVVFPPDGDMGAYMASLDVLRRRDDRIYYPAHGPAVTNPAQYVRGLMGHRLHREKQLLKLLGEGPQSVEALVTKAYPGLDPRLVPAAKGSVLAHLLDLDRRGLVGADDSGWSRRCA